MSNYYSIKPAFYRMIFIIILALSGFLSYTQRIENVRFEQDGKMINIYYDLIGKGSGEEYTVEVFCSTDQGNTWGSALRNVTGNVGRGQTSGYNKKITWDVLAEREKVVGNIVFEVRAVKISKGPEVVFVEGGSFKMGCDKSRDGNCQSDETPLHTVTVSSFYIGKTEVTNAQYAAFLNEYGSDKVKNGQYAGETMIDECSTAGLVKVGNTWRPATGKDNYPVIYVTWYGANEFCKYYGGRLPTEAEWKYAARGGKISKGYRYSGSNTLGEVAWYEDNSNASGNSNLYEGKGTMPVGRKKANELGLYDMNGNVWEWCSDWYDSDYYSSSPFSNPQGPLSGTYRVLRGGSWSVGSYYRSYVGRTAGRNRGYPDVRFNGFGFRFSRIL
jgi:sulfatase modifying factor 1